MNLITIIIDIHRIPLITILRIGMLDKIPFARQLISLPRLKVISTDLIFPPCLNEVTRTFFSEITSPFHFLSMLLSMLSRFRSKILLLLIHCRRQIRSSLRESERKYKNIFIRSIILNKDMNSLSSDGTNYLN